MAGERTNGADHATSESTELTVQDAIEYVRTLRHADAVREFCEQVLDFASAIGPDVRFRTGAAHLEGGIRVARDQTWFMWCYPKPGRVQLATWPAQVPPSVEPVDRGLGFDIAAFNDFDSAKTLIARAYAEAYARRR